jgi:hypothetical protein
MKKTEFKKVKISYDELMMKNFEFKLKQKRKVFNEMLSFVEHHIPELNKKSLYKNPLKYVEKEILKANQEQFSGISFHRIAFLIELDISTLNDLIREFDSIDIDINPDTLEPTETPDCNVYTLNEAENTMYYALQQITKGLNLYNSAHKVQLSYLLSGGIKFDFGKHSYEVNPRLIIHSRRDRNL